MSENSKLIEKLQKLMTLAADQKGLPEGDTAAMLARKLMADAGLVEADLNLSGKKVNKSVTNQSFKVGSYNYHINLAFAVARHCECAAVVRTNTREFLVYGREESIEVVKYLYEIILRQIDAAAKLERKSRYAVGLKDERWWNGFVLSAVMGVEQRLQAQRAAEVKEVAIVLASQSVEAAKAMRAAHPRTSVHKQAGARFNEAGFEVGKNVNLNAGMGHSGVSAAPQLG